MLDLFFFWKYCHFCVCCYLYLSVNRSLFIRFCFCSGIFLHIFCWWCSLCWTGRRDWEKMVWRKSNFIGFSKTTHGSGTQYETVSWQSFATIFLSCFFFKTGYVDGNVLKNVHLCQVYIVAFKWEKGMWKPYSTIEQALWRWHSAQGKLMLKHS